MKPVTIKLNEEELEILDKKAEQSNMSRSDYIRHCIKGSPIQVVDKSKEFYKSLCNIHTEICKIENQIPNAGLDSVKKEVLKACQLLNL